jgi:hypothetical protein
MAKAKRQMKKPAGGPFLDSALICEQVIRERDGTYSAIRMVNRLTLHADAPAPGVILVTPVWLLVSFKAGIFQGTQSLLFFIEDPSGKRYQPFHPAPMTFRGEDTGEVAVCPLRLRYDKDGTYWIEIVLNRKRFSRIPLTIAFRKEPS